MADPIDAFRTVLVGHLGAAPDAIEPGKLQRFSTNGRRSDKAGWSLLFPDLRGGAFGCYRQGINETWTAQDRATLTPADRAALARQIAQAMAERQQQQREHWASNAARIAQVWRECRPLVPGDPATLYLKRRGLGGLWPLPECLRLHSGLAYWHEGAKLGQFPAMVAPIVAPNGQTVALHRTYLTQDGRKAEVPTAKKLTGAAGSLVGAHIPLGKPLQGQLGVAEGIETALAGWAGSGLPTVAAYCAHSLAHWRWPPGVQRIVVFADHDRAGLEAADTLRARALQAGLRCEAHSPDEPGTDWADVWQQRHSHAEGGAA